jgi:hypothetical protein
MAGETPDTDPVETREWLESVDAVVEFDGRERMGYLLDQAIDHAQEFGVKVSAGLSTPYVNTIPVETSPRTGRPRLERLQRRSSLQSRSRSSCRRMPSRPAFGATRLPVGRDFTSRLQPFLRARTGSRGDLVYIRVTRRPVPTCVPRGTADREHLHRFSRRSTAAGFLVSAPVVDA